MHRVVPKSELFLLNYQDIGPFVWILLIKMNIFENGKYIF